MSGATGLRAPNRVARLIRSAVLLAALTGLLSDSQGLLAARLLGMSWPEWLARRPALDDRDRCRRPNGGSVGILGGLPKADAGVPMIRPVLRLF
jgi:hypothetical protein